MNWYTTRCLFKSMQDQRRSRDGQLVEYRYFLIQATDDTSAVHRAWKIAKSKEHTYVSDSGAKVTWILAKVLDVKEILAKELVEGTEVYYTYSQTKTQSKPESHRPKRSGG